MGKTNFWFATFDIENLSRDITDFDPSMSRDELVQQTLREYISTNESVTKSATGKWYFGAIDDRGDTILGKFGKEFTDETAGYDEIAGDFVDKAGERTDAQYSMFIIHFPDQILIYNTRNRVGYRQFPRNFAKGYNESHSGQLSIELLENKADIDAVVDKYRVFDAEFDLEPSNPSSGPEWESLDNSIHEMLADRLGVEVEAVEGSGINFDEEFLRQVFEMSKTEYGEFEILYDEDGYIKKISSGEGEPIIQRTDEPDNLAELGQISAQLINFARSFL